jgi:OOP family OmpA-OmpF porin
MKIITFVILIFIVDVSGMHAQTKNTGVHASSSNLIKNGGFDIRSRCPNRISQLKLATGWVGSGSPDLFCTCTPSKSSVYAELSFVGSLLPYNGECYSGFIVNPRYKEYLVYELPEKLRRRKTYCIRFLYARSEFSGLKVKTLGIYLHKEMHENSARGQPIQKKAITVPVSDHPGVWTAVSFTFTCKGGERFITLGSFDDNFEKILPKKNPKNTRIFNYTFSGYYFIEDVQLVPLRKGETCLPVFLPADTTVTPIVSEPEEHVDTIIPAKPFVLQQLNFETAKSDILPSSFDELDELADCLIGQPEMNLLIMGHTDDRGDERMNMRLSEARAYAVADYLASKGVTRGRLTWKGFGPTRPVADNTTEEGRAKNRRVEFQFN